MVYKAEAEEQQLTLHKSHVQIRQGKEPWAALLTTHAGGWASASCGAAFKRGR